MATYLTVTFKDKEIVKLLGARWDGGRRQWFVPEGTDEKPFARWIVAELGAGATNAPPIHSAVASASQKAAMNSGLMDATEKTGGAPQGAPLSTILFEASEAVRRALPHPRWIIAEIASCRKAAAGHYYLELVEHDQTGREIAKASGKIWSSSARIVKKFEKQSGGQLEAGMKILFLAQAEFSVQYGFSVTIQDIDPAWTLGEMQRKILEIRDKLQAEGIFELNKLLPRPRDFTRVALIAPDSAAGFGDFMADAEVIQKAGLCQFDHFGSLFEGAGAVPGILKAFAEMLEKHAEHPYDVLVMIRGGGATTSLNWLNEYDLAKAICVCPIPTFTGIGHERDDTILDEVAHERFDTPSKVVAGIFSRIAQNAIRAKESYEFITAEAKHACLEVESEVDRAWNLVEQSARAAAVFAENQVEKEMTFIAEKGKQMIQLAKEQTEALGREVIGLGPASVLSRGYSVVKKEGRPIAKVSSGVQKGDTIQVVLSDGVLEAKVEGLTMQAISDLKGLGG